MSLPGHSLAGVLPLCRGAVGVFYSPSQLGKDLFETDSKIKHTYYDFAVLLGLQTQCNSTAFEPQKQGAAFFHYFPLPFPLLYHQTFSALVNLFFSEKILICIHSKICQLLIFISCGGAWGVMVIVGGNGHGDTSSKPGQDWLHFT